MITYYSNDQDPSDIAHMLQQRDQVLQKLKQNLKKAHDRMKKLADKKRIEVLFEEGQWVFVKLQPYRQHFWLSEKKSKIGYAILWSISNCTEDR